MSEPKEHPVEISQSVECPYPSAKYCGYSQQTVDAITKERDILRSLCRELVKELYSVYFMDEHGEGVNCPPRVKEHIQQAREILGASHAD